MVDLEVLLPMQVFLRAFAVGASLVKVPAEKRAIFTIVFQVRRRLAPEKTGHSLSIGGFESL
jgi:hypothetical protein